MLSLEIHDAPPTIALLNVRESERRHLRASEPASEKHSQNRAIAETPYRFGIGRVGKRR
jgi:hypothetical protein